MSLTSSLQRIVQAKADIKSAIEAKGVTVGNNVSIADYDDYIAQITGGGSATLTTKTITSNGTYYASSDNADGYSSVTVNVSGGGGSSDVPFSSPRYIEIPTGGIFDCQMFANYIIGTTWRYSSSYAYTIGKKFCVYDKTTDTVLHTFSTELTNPSLLVMEYATGMYMLVISEWNTTKKPYAIWWYNENTDTFTYVEDQDEIDSTWSYMNIRYAKVLYKGVDFGIISTNTSGTNQVVLLKTNGTTDIITSVSPQIVDILETYDNDYYYLSCNLRTAETNGVYKVVRMQKNSEGYYYDTLSYNMGTGTSNNRIIHQCGRFTFFGGYSNSRYGYIVNMATGSIIINLSKNTGYNGHIMVDSDTQRIVGIASKATFIFDGAAYLNNEATYYTYDSTTTFSWNSQKMTNHKFYFGTYNSFNEVVLGTGVVTRIDLQGYTGINPCLDDKDLFVAYSSAGSQYGIYIYHTDTNTYDNLKTDTTSVSSFSIYDTTAQTWQSIDPTLPNIRFLNTNNSTGFVIYNTASNEYIYIRRNSLLNSSLMPEGCLATTGFVGTDTNMSIYMIKNNGGYLTHQTATLSSSAPSLSKGYIYNNKIYFQCYYSSPLAFYMLCYDITNDTLTTVLTDTTTNLYNSYFNYKQYTDNTGYEAYAPLIQNNLVIFSYSKASLDGESYVLSQQVSGNGKSLIFNTTNETWSVVDGYTIIGQSYSNTLIVYMNSGNQISTYNLSTGITTNTGITACNMGSAKCMSDGAIIIKQTTNLVKYDIATGTTTTLRTATSNSNSNNYGTIRGVGTVCYSLNNASGLYNAGTSTFTSMTNNTSWYSSSGYSKIFFKDISSTRYAWYLDDTTVLTVFSGTYSNPVTSGNIYYYAAIYFDTDKYIIMEIPQNIRKDNIYKYYYDGTSTLTAYYPSPTSSSISVKSQFVTFDGKPYLVNTYSNGVYDITEDEYFVLPLYNGTQSSLYLNINHLFVQCTFFALRKSFVLTLHDGAKTRGTQGYLSANSYVVLDTSSTTTKLLGLWQPTQEELAAL